MSWDDVTWDMNHLEYALAAQREIIALQKGIKEARRQAFLEAMSIVGNAPLYIVDSAIRVWLTPLELQANLIMLLREKAEECE